MSNEPYLKLLLLKGESAVMALDISVELSHVCPLEEIPKHAAALESLGYFRVWVPDTIVSPRIKTFPSILRP